MMEMEKHKKKMFEFQVMILLLMLMFGIGCGKMEEIKDDDIDDYPNIIRPINLRLYRDSQNGNFAPVTSGRLGRLGLLPSRPCDLRSLRNADQKKFSKAEVKRILQCAPTEPDLDEHSGSLSMMRRMPVTRETLEIGAAYGETHCSSWKNCQGVAHQFREKKFDQEHFGMDRFSGFEQFRMYRIINNTVYDDWPFPPLSRADESVNDYANSLLPKNLALIEFLAAKVYDLPDIVFFMGTEQAYLPWNFPIPAFSPVAKHEYNNIPWPWAEAIRDAHKTYMHVVGSNIDFRNETAVMEVTNELPWDQKIPKAAYFGSWNIIRQFAFDSAVAEPDLFDVSFSTTESAKLEPLNPISKESPTSKTEWLLYKMNKRKSKGSQTYSSAPETYDPDIPGSVWPLFNFSDARSYHPGNYKYVIVMLAMNGIATSGRVAEIMAHSGAVLLLQGSAMHYHFSARLIPWVHYVPISYSGADLIRKVKWLHAHDAEAKQLAENARIFARSYLRIEDYYCYALHSVEAVAKVLHPSALKPFAPRKISGRDCLI